VSAAPAPGSVLFLLAHHDDEVFCAGHLSRALAAGRRVCVLWATAGGLSPARRRLREGTQARRLLGLSASDACDLKIPDQATIEHADEIAREGLKFLQGAAEGRATVYVPAYEGGHPDHDALNLAASCLRLLRPDVIVREFPLYRRHRAWLLVQSPEPAAGTAQAAFDLLLLDEGSLMLRRDLARANASQLLPSLLPLLALAHAAGRARLEPSRLLPVHDYARPPQSRPLLYELYTRRRFPEFRARAAASLEIAGRALPARGTVAQPRPDGLTGGPGASHESE
jgi:LmbE family N-acetylglucosaminyl deacetylase